MAFHTLPSHDLDLVASALAGNTDACETIRSREMVRYLESLCARRGASATEAADLVADLLSDCLGASPGKAPLLQKYNGQGALRAFLARAVINRFIDLKRHQKFEAALPPHRRGETVTDRFDLLEGKAVIWRKREGLSQLLDRSLKHALSGCDPVALTLLHLVTIQRVNQSSAGRMMGWSQSKVSRTLSQTMQEIRRQTLAEVRRIDPWLDLKWPDFLQLCRSSNDILCA